MEIEKRIVAFVIAAICFSFVFIAQALSQEAQQQQSEFNKLNNILNRVDQRWPSTAGSQYSVPRSMPPPATPTPQAFSPTYSNYMRPGMPYSSESIPALQHSAVWRMLGNAMGGASGGAMAGQPGGNPFNLSPFGMLHYLWDDTTYVSAANPVTLYQTQNELQSAQHYSQMAQAASSRVRYARNPQEREEAARQAQYYANMAKQAAQQAQEVSESGSLNPAEVAQAAMQQAQSAEQSASQANRYAYRGF
jgi:hypothetical protein